MSTEAPAKAMIPDEAVCPFTGRPLQFIYSERSRAWRAVGEFYYTKWFDGPFAKQELMFHLHHRNGRPPAFSERPRIEVRERVRPVPDYEAEETLERDKVIRDTLDEEFSK